MLSITQALDAVRGECRQLAAVERPLFEAAGLVNAARLSTTAPSPPFTKAMMDGYAVCAADVAASDDRTLPIVAEVAARPGSPQPLPAGSAVRIMTGAPLPFGADAVVPVERTRETADTRRVTLEGRVEAGMNVLPVGSIAAAGQTLLDAGQQITPRSAAALAEFGHGRVRVIPRPAVAYACTGSELVAVDEAPGPGQIRNTSDPMLSHLLRSWGVEARPLGRCGDHVEELDRAIAGGLDADILLLTGGVSAGRYDLVPDRLQAAGVRRVFHKVAVKPGKPLWFGVVDTGARRTLVFGLPGNPVSSLVCAEVFVRPAVQLVSGLTFEERPAMTRLADAFPQWGDRTTYWPATLDGDTATPLNWQGSADLVRIAAADGWIIAPPGDRTHAAGETLPFHRATN